MVKRKLPGALSFLPTLFVVKFHDTEANPPKRYPLVLLITVTLSPLLSHNEWNCFAPKPSRDPLQANFHTDFDVLSVFNHCESVSCWSADSNEQLSKKPLLGTAGGTATGATTATGLMEPRVGISANTGVVSIEDSKSSLAQGANSMPSRLNCCTQSMKNRGLLYLYWSFYSNLHIGDIEWIIWFGISRECLWFALEFGYHLADIIQLRLKYILSISVSQRPLTVKYLSKFESVLTLP